MSDRRLIFLDIDGVLGHVGSDGKLDPSCIAELDWLIDETGADVVLTSSWRETFGVAETQRRLAAAGFLHMINAATPTFPQGSRSDEIDAFLAEVSCPARFVILDDVPTAAHLVPALVLIDDFTGFTGLEAALAKQLLTCPGAALRSVPRAPRPARVAPRAGSQERAPSRASAKTRPTRRPGKTLGR